MLANARVLGPHLRPAVGLLVLRPDGSLLAVVVEVHNTYGERHAYLLDVRRRRHARPSTRTSTSRRSTTSAGEYAVRLVLEPDTVSRDAWRLDRDGERVMTAVTRGTPEPATTRALLPARPTATAR